MKRRLIYPDLVKFFAIFLVTWSHCAQRVAGSIWTNFMGGAELDLALNMPLFMLISGWFINIEKMRGTPVKDFVFQKFKRLIIPSVVWYFVHQLLSMKYPDLTILKYYWYLNALFFCLCFILITTKFIKNNLVCIASSIILIMALPYTDFCHVNFMLPFLWAGYALRRVFESKYRNMFVAFASILCIALCPFWDHSYTVYRAPFNSLRLNTTMLFASVYRFLIGFCLSTVVIYIAYQLEKKASKSIYSLSRLGQYSLVIYTSSLAVLGTVKIILNYYNLHTNQYVVIDFFSLLLCVVLIVIAVLLGKYCRKQKVLSLLFLGE